MPQLAVNVNRSPNVTHRHSVAIASVMIASQSILLTLIFGCVKTGDLLYLLSSRISAVSLPYCVNPALSFGAALLES